MLLYHRVGRGGAFAAQLRRLHELGFEGISLDRYVRFVRGEPVRLPPRPLLVTFDDAYASALAVADPVLERYGWSAVVYVPTGLVGRPGHLTWDELRRMRSSGRWHVEEHAGDGHVLIDAGPDGRRLPFYAAELWRSGRQESFARYRSRVTGDVERGAAALARNLPGWEPDLTFAVPFGNYGQNGSNDARIEQWFGTYLTERFDAVFVQRGDAFAGAGRGFANRVAVSPRWDAGTLEAHLRRGRALLAARR